VMYNPRDYVGDFDWTWVDPAVAVGAHRVCGNDPNRVSLYLVNKGSANLFFGPFSDVSANNYLIRLLPGDTAAMYWVYDGILTTLEWYVFVAAMGASYGLGAVTFTPQRE
jgi:hypothetical protein